MKKPEYIIRVTRKGDGTPYYSVPTADVFAVMSEHEHPLEDPRMTERSIPRAVLEVMIAESSTLFGDTVSQEIVDRDAEIAKYLKEHP